MVVVAMMVVERGDGGDGGLLLKMVASRGLGQLLVALLCMWLCIMCVSVSKKKASGVTSKERKKDDLLWSVV